jgi:murein DD-endopeptidase MepM/ murein hydrolase activator NlpD
MSAFFRNLQGIVVLVAILGIAAFVLLGDDEPTPQTFVLPNAAQPTIAQQPAWQSALESRIDNSLTRVPTEEVPTLDFVPPTANIQIDAPLEIVGLTEIAVQQLPTSTPPPTLPGADPTAANDDPVSRSGSTPVPSPTGVAVAANDGSAVEQFQLPPEQVPLSLHPWDHFVFRRPVDASGNSESLFYYPYGARWQNTTRVHHGIDIPNPIGEQVLAAADGVVFYSGRVEREDEFEGMELYPSYGNIVVIQHDFEVDGEPVYTLYAHLQARSVQTGTRVEMGDVIGVVGNTGIVTGPHVHFEVRHGENSYWNTRNPLLWIAPYINHGVIAGRVVDAEGNYIDEVTVQLAQGGRTRDRTVTYAQPRGGVNTPYRVVPDNNRQENFVFGDVPAGMYQVIVTVNGRTFRQTIEVRRAMVNWMPEFRINPPASTPIPE